MKKILLILSLFVSVVYGQNVHNNNVSRKVGTDSIYYNTNSINSFAGRDTLLGVRSVAQNYLTIDSSVQVGTIYDSSTWNNIDAGVFTKTGTVTVTSNKITMPTGTNAIQWVTSTGFDQETFQVDLKMTALTTNDSFPQIGWTSTNTSPIPAISLYMSYIKSSNLVEMWEVIAGSRGNTYYSTALTGGISVNDDLSFIIDRDVDGNSTTTATVRNNTTGNSAVATTNINPLTIANVSSGILRNTGAFSITGRGATTNTLTVNRIYYHSIAPKYPKAVVIGYSIDYGSFATAFTSRYVSLLHMIDWGGASDGSQSGVRSMTALYTYMKPQNVFLTLIGNDIFYGVSSGTWQANMTAIHDTLTAHGIHVYFYDPTPRTATNMTPGKTWIEANYPGAFIDVFTPLLGSGTTLNATYDAGDGVHPNLAGHALIASTTQASSIFTGISGFNYIRYYAPNNYINPATGLLDSLAHATIADIPRYAPVTIIPATTLAGSAGDVQFKNANGGFSTAPTSLFHYDSTNKRLGIGTATPAQPIHLIHTVNGLDAIAIVNSSNGSSARAALLAQNDGGTVFQAGVEGSAWAGYGDLVANGAFLYCAGAGGINIMADANAPFTISTGTAAPAVERFKISGTGVYTIPSSSFATGAVTDSVITESTSAGVMTIKKVAQTTYTTTGTYRAITAIRTLDATDHIINCTANSFTVTLPTAVGITGKEYIIKNTGTATTITIATTSSQTIDGSAPGTITTLIPLRVVSDGANWITF